MTDSKSKAGRKSLYEESVKSRFKEIETWLKAGSTNDEIIKMLGISKNTYYTYLKKYREFADLLKNNRKAKVMEIKNALFKRAVGFKYTETTKTVEQVDFDDNVIKILSEAGVDVLSLTEPIVTKTKTSIKQALPDPASCMILLKHWDKEEEWTNDPQTLKIKKEELKIKKENNEF